MNALISANPFSPPEGTERSVREKAELPISFPVFATLDIIAAGALAFVAFGTWYGAGFGAGSSAFASIFVATEVMAASLLVVSLVATAIALFLKQRFAWLPFLVSQSIVAFGVLFTFAVLAYVLIDTWGVSNMMYSGGDPKTLAIMTLIYFVAQTVAAIPIVVLIRNRPDRRVVRANHNSEF